MDGQNIPGQPERREAIVKHQMARSGCRAPTARTPVSLAVVALTLDAEHTGPKMSEEDFHRLQAMIQQDLDDMRVEEAARRTRARTVTTQKD